MIYKAINAFNDVLKVYSPEFYAYEWAKIQFHRANAYYVLYLLSQNSNQIKLVIDSYKASLDIFTPSFFTYDCFMTAGRLGYLGNLLGDWDMVIDFNELAIQCIENLRTSILSDSERQQILAQTIEIYENLIQSYINTNQIDKAIATVERYRCKQLVDLMASKDLYSDTEIPPEVQKYLELRSRIDSERQQLD